MSEAPRKRPQRYTVLHSARGHVRARPKAVFDAIASRLDPGPNGHSMFTADPRGFTIIVQGGWWYRAEYQIVPDDDGCNVEHAVLNVAKTAHKLGLWAGRKEIAAAPAEFEKLLRQLRLEVE